MGFNLHCVPSVAVCKDFAIRNLSPREILAIENTNEAELLVLFAFA